MRKVFLSSILILLSFQTLIFAQRDSIRTLFLDAESWFLFEEYADALPLYQALHEKDPGNDNLNYRIGVCLLNDPCQKDRAIQYLLDACENINPDYKAGHYKERTAPPDALYHLGNAYLVNELLNHAIESYEEFLSIMDPDVYDAELVHAQIQSCKNAQRLKTMPVDIDLTLQDEIVNTRYSDTRPVVSGDGTKMAFVTELPSYDGTFYTEQTADGWSYPQIITQSLGFDEDIYPVSLSYDGSEMILYYDDNYIGSLYYSRYENGLWSPALKMGAHISTKYWESHACFSKDGQSLYFTSNRKGTKGGLDIYVSGRNADGSWGPASNLGPTINSPHNEESPYISEDGNTLYFSSYGHYNMGGYDIFYSKRGPDGAWGEPVNIGYPINTTDNDLYFQPIKNGDAAYYSVYSPRGIGRHDIYLMDIYSVNNPRYYTVSGSLRSDYGALGSSRVNIRVVDTENDEIVVRTHPGQDGSFSFDLKQGIYELHVSSEGYEYLIRPLRITPDSDKSGIRLRDDLTMERIGVEDQMLVFEGEESQIQLRGDEFEGVAEETLKSELQTLSPEQEGISNPQQLFEHLYEQADTRGYHKNEVDAMLADELSRGDAELLRQLLIEHSEGELNDYLQQTDLKAEGITNAGELLRLLEEVAESEGFDMDAVRGAMSESLGSLPEVDRLYQELLESSKGDVKEILRELDLRKEGIYTTEELVGILYLKLIDEAYSKEEIEAILSELFPGHSKLIGELLDIYGEGALPETWPGWLHILLPALVGLGILWLIILWRRRRDKKNEQEK